MPHNRTTTYRAIGVATAWLAALATCLNIAPWPEPPAHAGCVALAALTAGTSAWLASVAIGRKLDGQYSYSVFKAGMAVGAQHRRGRQENIAA